MKSIQTRRLIGTLLVLFAVGGGSTLLPSSRAAPARQDLLPGAPRAAPPAAVPKSPPAPLRYQRNKPGDSKPILLDADEAVTWVEKGQRLILLQGQVLVQQGTVRLRCQAAAVFVNLDRLQRTGILHADLYAEEGVRLEDGSVAQKGARALLDLNTRGELKLSSHKKKVVQVPQPGSAVLQRAVVELTATPQPPGREETSEPTRRTPPQPPREGVPSTPPGPAPGTPLPPVPVPPAPPPGLAPLPPAPPPPPQQTGSLHRDADVVQAQFLAPEPPPGAPTVVPPAAPPPPAGTAGPPSGILFPPRPVAGGPAVDAPLRQYNVIPRSGAGYHYESAQLPGGEEATIFTGGVLIAVTGGTAADMIDIEADSAVVWSRGGLTPQMLEKLRGPGGQSSRELEFYLAGNVQIRQRSITGTRLLSAEEVYLDANRSVAIAVTARLEFANKGVPQPIVVRADELKQVSQNRFNVIKAEIFSSKLPSDPGLKVLFTEAVIDEVKVPKRALFGGQLRDRKGNPLFELEHPVDARNARAELEGVPFYYWPWYHGDANRPLGPFQSFGFGENRIFGAMFTASFDVYALFGARAYPDTRWRADLDYLSRRGPAAGTEFAFSEPAFFGQPAQVSGIVKGYVISDKGTDILGGGRGDPTVYPQDNHPNDRGRLLYRENVQNLANGLSFQAQASYLSDRNFLEQYYKIEFDQEINQETFLYVKEQPAESNWAVTGLVEPRLRNWVTETQWLPRTDGWLLGYSPFQLFTYNAHASAGYAQLKFTHDPPPGLFPQRFAYAENGTPVDVTDLSDSTARLDLFQELSLPFYTGPVKLAPYALLDTAYYSRDEQGNQIGRVWGGGGVRASMPLSRLYPDVHSLLWNLDGLYHKIVLSADYRYVATNVSHTRLPQLDRLNDDATDQALRDLRPQLLNINPANGFFLLNSPVFDPQLYAIRRMVDNRIDTLDGIEVLQLDARQRLQTKRGFPGQEHIIDWMTLDTSVSLFPAANRDNFGKPYSFAEYDYVWNIGDRTAVTSSGLYDPFDHGPRFFALGAYLNRPDRTSFYLGYRQIDPVQSKAVTASANYVFSPKYAMTASSTYDFGTSQALSNTVLLTRLGTDLNVSFGITYNALQNNFGVLFQIVPNLLPPTARAGGPTSLSGPGGGLLGR